MKLNLHPLDLIIITGYLIIILSIGVYVRKFAKGDINAFFLGGKSFHGGCSGFQEWHLSLICPVQCL